MGVTSRELMYQALEFRGPARAPRQLWALPWAGLHHQADLEAIVAEFPQDIANADPHLREATRVRGDAHAVGRYVDAWGCTFENLQAGVIGEVKTPLVQDWERDRANIHVPREWLSIDVEAVNRYCDGREEFVMGGCCPRPFEQLQFLRGSENFFLDLAEMPAGLRAFMGEMHAFYCELLELWAKNTRVDGLMFMDDWGSQRGLLIAPAMWREYFRPMYRDYIQIAHGHGKKALMHSDGHILSILPDLVELGLDAINSQIFCMGVQNLRPFAGKITFWGEIDRQRLLPHGTVEEIREAVRSVHENLWRDGGCIAQCEFGAAANPRNVREVFAAWDELTRVDQ